MAKNNVILALTAALVGGGVVYTSVQPDSWFENNVVQNANITSAGETKTSSTSYDGTTAATTAYNKVAGSVVTVENLQSVASLSDWSSFFNGGSTTQSSGELETASEGSGVVVKISGDNAYVITNHHVVEDSAKIQLILSNGTKISATIVGQDENKDLALLKTNAKYFKTAVSFANMSQVQVGQTVLAIGSPLGSEYATSVTKGIISAKNRTVQNSETNVDEKVVQTDAAINNGNSGGPLINLSGEIVGINSMKISGSSDSEATVEGLGFAIPANTVQSFMESVLSK